MAIFTTKLVSQSPSAEAPPELKGTVLIQLDILCDESDNLPLLKQLSDLIALYTKGQGIRTDKVLVDKLGISPLILSKDEKSN